MTGQRPVEQSLLVDELLHMTGGYDPGTSQEISLGPVPRDCFFERGMVSYTAPNTAGPLTGFLRYRPNPAVDSNHVSISENMDFNAAADRGYEWKALSESNFLRKGTVIWLRFSGAPNASLGTIQYDLQFRTQRM
jgi:hypothetical protein